MYLKIDNHISEKDYNNIINKLDFLNIKYENRSTLLEKFIFVFDNEIDSKISDKNIIGISKYKLSAKYMNDFNFNVKNITINKKNFIIIGGPCSVESKEQISTIVAEIKDNINILRGGVYKPRTSPYEFQGMKEEGMKLLVEESKGIPIISEITSITQFDMFEKYVDIIQVGARNMQNFELLKILGKSSKPILLKRGLSNTIDEWILASEYILNEGNKNVILCERGIRTFEQFTRNTLDLSAVIAAKELTCLPVFVDPSHAAGKWWMIEKLSKAALAAGADGLIIETHNNPKCALSDGPQSLKTDKFNKLIEELKILSPHFDKVIL